MKNKCTIYIWQHIKKQTNIGNTDATYSFLDMRMFNHKFFLEKDKRKKKG